MKIAYLTNQYPKVSHTFIRREIRALEEEGLEVERFSVRESPDQLQDPEDQEEALRTRVVLKDGVRGLLGGMARRAVKSPLKFAKATRTAVEMGIGSERGVLRHLAYLGEACVLEDWLAKSDCEHVHAHFGTNSTTVAMLCHELGGPTYSFTVHGPEEFDKPHIIGLGRKIAESKFVAGVSSFGRSQLYRHAAQSHWDKVHVVRCGVDHRFLEQELTPVPEAPRLTCVGRLCEQKGQLLLVEATAKLKARGRDFELVLVGDGEMRREVEDLIHRHQLEGQIKITGWMSNDAVRDHIVDSRALVLPSFAEGLPVAIMEALGLGRPVVSTYIAGIPELVEPEACGWLVPAGSVDALVEAMDQVLGADQATLSKMGAEGQRRVREMHDVRKNAAGLHALITR
ncbi:MAG: glycosyltransferase [Myxococcota bacterium]